MSKLILIFLLFWINIGILIFIFATNQNVEKANDEYISKGPTYVYPDKTGKKVNYYLSYQDIKLIYDARVNNIIVDNGSETKLNVLSVNGFADQLLPVVFAEWGKVNISESEILLNPPAKCTHLSIETKADFLKQSYTLDQISTGWEVCDKLPSENLVNFII